MVIGLNLNDGKIWRCPKGHEETKDTFSRLNFSDGNREGKNFCMACILDFLEQNIPHMTFGEEEIENGLSST